MKVYDKPIVVKKKEDGSYIISVAVSDSCVAVKTLNRKDIELLWIELEKLLMDVSK